MVLRTMIEARKSPFVTSSISKKDLPKPSIYRLDIKVWRLILQFVLTSHLKLPSGWSLIPICNNMRTCKDLNLKSKWRIKRTRSLFKSNNSMLKIHCTPLQWREHSRSWRGWLFKMLMKRSLKTTNTTKMLLRIEIAPTLDPSFLFGVSQMKKHAKSMLHQFNGIQNIKIFSRSVMVLMIS